MTTYLLDTSILIDVLNQKHNRRQMLEILLLKGDTLACCSVTVTEIYAGMREHERTRTDQLLNSLIYYDVTHAIAKDAGLLKRDYGKQGITLSLPDVTIAAVAIAYRLPLITDNVKHFPMPSLTLYPLPPMP